MHSSANFNTKYCLNDDEEEEVALASVAVNSRCMHSILILYSNNQ